jgi:hypothetical protein
MKLRLNKLVGPGLVLSGLFLFLLLTNPQKVPLIVLLVPFILIAIAFFMIVIYLQNLSSRSNPKRKAATASLVTFELITLLVLSSLHQLSIKDIVLVLVLGVLFMAYIKRLSP